MVQHPNFIIQKVPSALYRLQVSSSAHSSTNMKRAGARYEISLKYIFAFRDARLLSPPLGIIALSRSGASRELGTSGTTVLAGFTQKIISRRIGKLPKQSQSSNYVL